MEDYLDPFSEYLLKRHRKAVFLNGDLDVLYIHGDLDSIFRLPTSIARLNIEKMLPKKEAVLFSEGVRNAIKDGQAHVYSNVIFTKEEQKHRFTLNFQIADLPKLKRTDVVMVEFEEEGNGSPFEKEELVESGDNSLAQHIYRLESELNHYRHKVRALEMIGNNRIEQLHTGDRELVMANEQLQNTNEELQSLNEELHTVNAELQIKNKELTVANDDIVNFLNSTNIGTIFLDSEYKIRRFTPAILKQFDLISSDIGRPITSFTSNLKDVDLKGICNQVLHTKKSERQVVLDQEGRRFLMKVTPYKTHKEEIDGVVISLVNLARTKNMLEKFDGAIKEMARKFEAIFNNSESPLLFVDRQGRISEANQKLGSYAPDEMIGNNIFDLLPEDQVAAFKAVFEDTFFHSKFNSVSLSLKNGGKERYSYKVNLIPIPDRLDENKVGMVSIIAIENTQEANYLKHLEEVKSTYTSFMDNAQHRMLLLNEDGTIIYINDVSKATQSKEELIGTRVYDLLPASEVANYKKSIEAIFQGKANSKISFRYVYPDKSEREVSVIATPVVVRGEIVYVALIGDPLD